MKQSTKMTIRMIDAENAFENSIFKFSHTENDSDIYVTRAGLTTQADILVKHNDDRSDTVSFNDIKHDMIEIRVTGCIINVSK